MVDNALVDLTGKILGASDFSMLWTSGEEFFARFGFSQMNYGLADSRTGEMIGIHSNMSDEWMSHYVASDYARLDPWVRHACEHSHHALYSESVGCAVNLTGSDEERKFINECTDTGLYRTVLVPYRDVSGQSIGGLNLLSDMSHDEFTEIISSHLNTLLVGATLFNSHINMIDEKVKTEAETWHVLSSSNSVLSPREMEVLNWLAAGLRNDRIAEKMQISSVTVNFHIMSIKKKLHAKTREHAVAIAFIKKLIR